MTKWHKGPPPEIGWWPASASRCTEIIRWWDGENWSLWSNSCDNKYVAARRARQKAMFGNDQIEWSERWWEKKNA